MVNILGNSGGDSLITKLTSYLTTEALYPTKGKSSPAALKEELQQGGVDEGLHVQRMSVPASPSYAGAGRQALQKALSDSDILNGKRAEEHGTLLTIGSQGELQQADEEHITRHVSPGYPRGHRNDSNQILQPSEEYHDPVTCTDKLHYAQPRSEQRLISTPNSSNHTLKPCIKTKAKSTPSSPPGGPHESMLEDCAQSLRRVKTVDFDENGPSASDFLPMPAAIRVNERPRASDLDQPSTTLSKGPDSKPSPCPIKLSTNKATPADPALTRTDVHAIAIAQSSRHGKRGLERVNSKLADWSRTWNSPPDSFKPTVITPDYDCTIEDDDYQTVPPPPNSQRTSAGHSRHHSRAASWPTTRFGSEEDGDDILPVAAFEFTQINVEAWDTYPEEPLVMPDPDGRRGRTSHTGQTTKQTPAIRKLSNIEDADVHFRGHRDSVGVAHARMLRSEVGSPHRDSVALAKKRLRGKKHATPGSQELTHSEGVQAVLSKPDIDDAEIVSQETVKECARHALEKSSESSISRREDKVHEERHIRIAE